MRHPTFEIVRFHDYHLFGDWERHTRLDVQLVDIDLETGEMLHRREAYQRQCLRAECKVGQTRWETTDYQAPAALPLVSTPASPPPASLLSTSNWAPPSPLKLSAHMDPAYYALWKSRLG